MLDVPGVCQSVVGWRLWRQLTGLTGLAPPLLSKALA